MRAILLVLFFTVLVSTGKEKPVLSKEPKTTVTKDLVLKARKTINPLKSKYTDAKKLLGEPHWYIKAGTVIDGTAIPLDEAAWYFRGYLFVSVHINKKGIITGTNFATINAGKFDPEFHYEKKYRTERK